MTRDDPQGQLDKIFGRASRQMGQLSAQLWRREHRAPADAAGVYGALFLEKRRRHLLEPDEAWTAAFETEDLEPLSPSLETARLLSLVHVFISRETLGSWARPELRSAKLEALSQLHAHAILIAREVLLLVSHGYPAGARARWRSLHEVAVTTRLLSKRGQNLSRRYLDHRMVEMKKLIDAGHLLASPSRRRSAERDLYTELSRRVDVLLREHGDSFAKPNGWAVPLVPRGRITFESIEKAAGRSRRRGKYVEASKQVHSTMYSAVSATQTAVGDLNFVGPRSAGLAELIPLTMWTLCEIAGEMLREAHRLAPRAPCDAWDACSIHLTMICDLEAQHARSTLEGVPLSSIGLYIMAMEGLVPARRERGPKRRA